MIVRVMLVVMVVLVMMVMAMLMFVGMFVRVDADFHVATAEAAAAFFAHKIVF
jgi:hypothetical protein